MYVFNFCLVLSFFQLNVQFVISGSNKSPDKGMASYYQYLDHLYSVCKIVLSPIYKAKRQTALLKTRKRRADDELVGPQIRLQPC